MEFVFFHFRRTDKMDSVMKRLMGRCPIILGLEPPLAAKIRGDVREFHSDWTVVSLCVAIPSHIILSSLLLLSLLLLLLLLLLSLLQIVILVTSVVNVWYSSSSIASSSGLPLLNQSLSWTILGKFCLTIYASASEYWRWLRPPLGKKRRVLHISRPCYQDCWHTDPVG